MNKGFFITATDTSVGKTIISAAMVRALNYLGYRTAAMKPIETGCNKIDDMLMPQDGLFLKNVSGMDENISDITPCTYENPLSPLAAGEIEGRTVDLAAILDAYNELTKRYDAIVVEGIGGISVPVTKDYFVSDLALQMGLPLIIVARPTLGTINHTLLTVHYAVAKGMEIAGIILNYSSEPEGGVDEDTDRKTLESVTDIPIIGVFPHLADFEEETIDRATMKSLNTGILKNHLS
ncbi:ATP-dependent dethiobiotin synthetase BioD 1 [bacterium BMS3Abin07]|nr:ATP-dependent dethiobiotin synthetase BioD 1 [bacterium BMS3Abin07]GBE32526.1 ATP-dependent dethiobiotin synthetase BioD 1 [bacterium BMS3Bbin05]HDO23429.1 dethiobiotin synthase [Nitrospirota bacterium]HDZ88077.1 dethiobiotin synthase [Nitrospirota bacterium]